MSLQEQSRVRLEIPTLDSEKSAFRSRIIGQEEPIQEFAILFAKLNSGMASTKKGPIDIKFLTGPSGVGKTEIVYVLAELLQKNEEGRKKVLKINGGEYQDQYTIARLIGSPPGYVGFDAPGSGTATQAVFSQENLDSHKIYYTDKNGRQKHCVIILLDEAEKADHALHKIFLGILDKGQINLGNNKSSDVTNALIFYTSNIGNELVERLSQNELSEKEYQEKKRLIFTSAFQKEFPPEFRGRIGKFVIFENLSQEALQKITELKLKELEQYFNQNHVNIELSLSQSALDWIIEKNTNQSEGARALQKMIDQTIQNALILIHTAQDLNGKKILIDKDDDHQPELSFYFVGDKISVSKITKQEQPSQNATLESAMQKIVEQPSQSTNSTDIRAIAERELQKRKEQNQLAHRQNDRQTTSVPGKIQKEIIRILSVHGVREFIEYRNDVVNQGLSSYEEINNLLYVKTFLRKHLIYVLAQEGLPQFVLCRNSFIKEGIGSEEEWNNLLR